MILVFRYVALRIIHRIVLFFEHWYVGGLVLFLETTRALIGRIDSIFAVIVTARNFFKPLFQDRTIIGYILGFIFRSFRILIGSVIYIVIGILAALLYLLWAAIPVYSIVKLIHEIVIS